MSYAVGGLDLSGVWRYVDSMHDINFPDYETSQYDCFDLYASYTVKDRQRMQALCTSLAMR